MDTLKTMDSTYKFIQINKTHIFYTEVALELAFKRQNDGLT